MANNMNVSLDTSKTPYRLSVDDHGGQNQVSQNPHPTTISWNLTGQLTQGNFVAMDCAEPGFDFVEDTGSVFSIATISANGNSVSVQDNHVDSTSNGSWIYVLRVEYMGTIYATTYELVGPGGTVNNPVIVNH
jgi:hypothetical protein